MRLAIYRRTARLAALLAAGVFLAASASALLVRPAAAQNTPAPSCSVTARSSPVAGGENWHTLSFGLSVPAEVSIFGVYLYQSEPSTYWDLTRGENNTVGDFIVFPTQPLTTYTLVLAFSSSAGGTGTTNCSTNVSLAGSPAPPAEEEPIDSPYDTPPPAPPGSGAECDPTSPEFAEYGGCPTAPTPPASPPAGGGSGGGAESGSGQKQTITPVSLSGYPSPLIPSGLISNNKSFGGLVFMFLNLIDFLVIFLMGVALIIFLWGIIQAWVIGAGNEQNVEKGKQFALAGLIGFVVVFSLWGIVALVRATFFGG